MKYLFLSLLLIICGCTYDNTHKITKYQNITGYDEFKFGMSKSEVSKIQDTIKSDFQFEFEYINDGLACIKITNNNLTNDEFEEITTKLSSKYGKIYKNKIPYKLYYIIDSNQNEIEATYSTIVVTICNFIYKSKAFKQKENEQYKKDQEERDKKKNTTLNKF